MDYQDSLCIFDFSAVVHHCLNSGMDDNQVEDADGSMVNSAEHGFGVFMDEYLQPILSEAQPRQIIAVHDGGCAYREAIHPDYKAQRKAKKEQESASQKTIQFQRLGNYIKSMLAAIGATQCQVKGVEADDLIGYLCGLPVPKRIYTSDVDLLQLASDTCQIFLKNTWIDPNSPDSQYASKFALMLHETCGPTFPRYLALAKSVLGDASDEYGGVKGFGEVAWREMVGEIGLDGLDELASAIDKKQFAMLDDAALAYEQEGKVPKWLKLLQEQRPEWRKCWVLANLHPELCWRPWKRKTTRIEWFKRIPSKDRLTKVLNETGYSYLLPEFEGYMPTTRIIDANNIGPEFLDHFAKEAALSPAVPFDYETWDDQHENFKQASTTGSHVDVPRSRIAGCSFAYGANYQHAVYLTVDHKDSANLPAKAILEVMSRVPDHVPMVAHNSAFEIAVTKCQLGATLVDVHDTMIMSKYVDEDQLSGLKACSKRELNYNQATFAQTIAKAGFEGATMRDLTVEQVVDYGADDSVVTGHLYDLFKLRMMLEQTWGFYSQHEPSTINVLVDAHIKGVRVDWDRLHEITAEDTKRVIDGMARLRQILAEHCVEVNDDALNAYAAAERKPWAVELKGRFSALPEALLDKEIEQRLGGGSDMDRAGKVAKLVEHGVEMRKQEVAKAAQYVEYRETKTRPEFIPTPKKFAAVCEVLGFDQPIENASMKALREWIRQNSGFDVETGVDPNLSSDQAKFIELLAAAVPQLKDRAGGNYDKLKAFCEARLPDSGKVLKSGTELNLGSPKQGQVLLYVMLGAKVRNRTRPQNGSFRQQNGLEGAPSTDVSALDTALAEDFDEGSWQAEAVNVIKDVKTAQTRISLYHTPYPLWRHPDDGLIYPSIRDFGTVTGRPSGSAPNLLQVSKHQDDAIMRSVFLPREDDHLIVAIDFAGQELRLLASRSEDPNLLASYIGTANAQAYLQDKTLFWTADDVAQLTDLKDIHSQTATEIAPIFGLPQMSYEQYIEQLHNADAEHHGKANKIRKRPAKTTNFLLAYGGTPPALAQKLIIKEAVATRMMDRTLKLYSGIEKWQERSAEFARRHGYTVTAYGKRRHASNDIFSTEGGKRARMERQLANAEIQGCAADILKVVLSDSYKQGVWDQCRAVMIAPVYDEIVASVHKDDVVLYIRLMRKIMNVTPPGQPVPMVADVSLGADWQKQIEIGTDPSVEEIEAAIAKAMEGKA